MVLTFDSETLRLMNYFKQATKVQCRDCFEFNGTIVFVTNAKEAGLAVGREGSNKRFLERNLHKKVKILGAADAPQELTRNFVLPLRPAEVKLERQNSKNSQSEFLNHNRAETLASNPRDSDDSEVISIKFNTPGERRVLLSRNLENLKLLKAVMARYFPNIANIIVLQ